MKSAADYFGSFYDDLQKCAICVDDCGRIGYVNRCMLMTSGCSPEDVIGRNFSDIFSADGRFPRRCYGIFGGVKIFFRYSVNVRNSSPAWPGDALTPVPGGEYAGWKMMLCNKIQPEFEAQISDRFIDLADTLSVILDNVPVQLFIKDVEAEFQYVVANRNFMDYYHLESKDVINQDDFKIFAPEVARQLRRHDMKVCAEPGKIFNFMEDISYLRKRQETFKSFKVCFLDHLHHKYLLGVCSDITEQKNSELELQHTSMMLKTLVDAIPASIYVKDAAERRFLFVNKLTAGIIGRPAEEILGKTDYDFLPPATAREFGSVPDEALRLNKLAANVFTYDLGKYQRRTEKLFAMPMDNVVSGQKEVLMASFDITHEVNLEKENRLRSQYQTFINEILESSIQIAFDEKDRNGHDRACKHVLERFAKLLDADQCVVVQYDMTGMTATVYCSYSKSVPLNIRPIHFNAAENWWAVLRSGRPLILENLSTSGELNHLKEWKELIHDRFIEAHYECGVFHDDELLGGISISYAKDNPHNFGALEIELLQSVGHIIDILLAYRSAQVHLQRSEYEKRLILETIPVPILLLDAEGRVQNANAAAEKEIGTLPLTADSIISRTFMDLQFHQQETLIGKRRYIVKSNPIVMNGKLANVLATYIDITELSNAQQKLLEAMHAAEAANKAKSFFLANMSHELRTPLNAVLGYCDLLQDGNLRPKEIDEYLECIQFSGNALLRLINNILDLSKIEAGRMVFADRPADLALLLQEMKAIFKQLCEKNTIEMRLELKPGLPLFMIDDMRLRQILLNIIGNACKFTCEGFINIRLDCIAESSGRFTLKIAVEDSGCGISPDMIHEIFNPFVQQNDMKDSHVYQGSGLGLTISKAMVEHMGGRLELESEVGKGSTFTVILPDVEIAGASYAEPVKPVIPHELSAEQRGYLDVLLVDDVAMNLKMLSVMCNKLGVRNRTAASAEEALAMMRFSPPNLVLTDMWMPGMNGPEFLAEIRKDAGLKHIPVVIVTADLESRDNGVLDEFDDIATKPISKERLEEIFFAQSSVHLHLAH